MHEIGNKILLAYHIHSAAERRARHRAATILHVRNDPKTIPKRIKVTSKSLQTPGLEAPKSRSRGPRGRLWSVLGCLGLSRAFLEASWFVLEASWRGFGGLLSRLGSQHWSKLLPKTEAKSIKKRSQNRSFFYSSWNRFWDGFWYALEFWDGFEFWTSFDLIGSLFRWLFLDITASTVLLLLLLFAASSIFPSFFISSLSSSLVTNRCFSR